MSGKPATNGLPVPPPMRIVIKGVFGRELTKCEAAISHIKDADKALKIGDYEAAAQSIEEARRNMVWAGKRRPSVVKP
ncbi:MAG: hypothetical protein WCD70_06710 [Alphaproteobacteria bacterium]